MAQQVVDAEVLLVHVGEQHRGVLHVTHGDHCAAAVVHVCGHRDASVLCACAVRLSLGLPYSCRSCLFAGSRILVLGYVAESAPIPTCVDVWCSEALRL